MTKAEAKDKGEELGRQLAESIFTSVTPFSRLPGVLEEYRHPKRWERRWAVEITHRPDLSRPGAEPLPKNLLAAMKLGFVNGGVAGIKEYIKELKNDGLLKEAP